MRPVSNLNSNPQFKIDKATAATGFVSLWKSRPGMSAYEFAAILPLNLLFPFTRGKIEKVETKIVKDFINNNVKASSLLARCSLRRDASSKSLIFRSPIYSTMSMGGSVKPTNDLILTSCLAGRPVSEQLDMIRSVSNIDQIPFVQTSTIPMAEVIQMIDVPEKTKVILRNSLISVESETIGSLFTLWATWRIRQKEAEYLNNCPFLEIKLSNFYGPLTEWATSCYGRDTSLPETISSVINVTQDVKQTLLGNTNVKPRVGVDGMIVDINHQFYILPDVDRAAEYEQKLMDFGLKEDGSYSWRQEQNVDDNGNIIYDMGSDSPSKKLPANIPIFTDWLNDKFVYSNTAGTLTIFELSNTVPVKAFHVQKVLNMPLQLEDSNDAAIAILITGINTAASIDRSLLLDRPTEDEVGLPKARIDQYFQGMASFQGLLKAATALHKEAFGDLLDFHVVDGEYLPYLYQLDPVKGVPSLRFLGRILHQAYATIASNQDVLYSKLSVITVTRVMAILNIVDKYAKDRDHIVALDKTERDAYINQELDPDYKVEALPSLRKDLKYLPHQFKVTNKMRKGPAFAIWSVAAGGGKTILAVTNIINELQKKRCTKPLILCPSHLVAQYVKEIVYATEGRINVIPVSNTTFKIHGEDSLRTMIEKSPLNTIVVSDFNFVKNRQDTVAYGTKSIEVYRNAEFLRQFQFDIVVIDESHFLKNVASARRGAVAKLIQDIPMKRLASGTIVADTIKDVVSQVALLDPTIFGSVSYFIKEFAADYRGDKVLAWKPNAERMIRQRINEHCVFASAKRKEWAALLPPSHERFLGVKLTANQRVLYESILQETMDLIKEALAKNKDLKDAMESEDDTRSDELEAMLRPYMARLERFLSAPNVDPAAQVFLKDPMDMISPKALMIYKICKEHLDKNLPGKILIFTQYTASAEAVFNNAPAELKNLFIWYTADNKTEARADYESNPNKKIMVGVSSSMDTGLNFQHVSRLIRMETVWTPGVLEQGNSRINRPQVKTADIRPAIYFDWLVVNRSVDITKVGRLISKIISKSKFDEFDNPEYQNQDDLPPVPITLESIAANNDFEADLSPYLEGHKTFQRIVAADYEQYKLENLDKLEPVPVPQKGLLEGSKLMSRVPYVPEMEVYGASKLGLIRYDEFLRQDIADLESDTDTDSDSDDEDAEGADDALSLDPKVLAKRALREKLAKERVTMRDRAVHTEFGDGVVTGLGPRRVRVRLTGGRVILLFKMQVFVITRATTNGIDIRNELLKQVGEIPLDTPITVPVEEGLQDKKRKQKGKGVKVEEPVAVKETMEAEFDFTILNDHLGIMYRGDSSNPEVVNALQNFGFRISPHYMFSRVPNHRILINMFKVWRDKGFEIDIHTNTLFKHIYDSIRANKTALQQFGFSTKLSLTNFYRQEVKVSADAKLIKVYPMVQDGRLYLMLPTKGQAGNMKATKVRTPGINWKQGGGEDEIIKFVTTKVDAKNTIKQVMDAGIDVTNAKELGEQFSKIKLVNRR